MNTLKITAKDIKKSDSYWSDYIGTTDVSNYDGNIEIDGNLGYVKFVSIKATGHILAKAGSGIEAGEGIKAGWSIKAGLGIEAGYGIKAGDGIEAGWGIKAGSGITAGSGIEAGDGITAGSGITAGDGIKAGLGITSFYSWVKAKLAISFNEKCTLSAGIFSTNGEQVIEAQEIKGGKIIYGKVSIIPKEEIKPSLTGKEVSVTLDGVTYKAVIQ